MYLHLACRVLQPPATLQRSCGGTLRRASAYNSRPLVRGYKYIPLRDTSSCKALAGVTQQMPAPVRNAPFFSSVQPRTAPISGRKQHISELARPLSQPFVTFGEVLKYHDQPVLERHGPVSTAVGALLSDLLKANVARELQHIGDRICVYADFKQSNAHVATGHIFISTAMLLNCKTTGQVASVLAHELGHVLYDHVVEKHTALMFQRFLSNCDTGYKDLLELSRVQEYEADHAGLLIMSGAGYDPEIQIDVLRERTIEESTSPRNLVPDEQKSHPPWHRRLYKSKSHLPEAKAEFGRSSLQSLAKPWEWKEIQDVVMELKNRKQKKH